MPRKEPVREKILSFLTHYFDRNGYAPSMREIAAGVGLSSPATVYYHLKKLEDDGAISLTDAKSRTIRLARENNGIPVVGRVAAGAPILADQNIEGYLPWQGAHRTSGVDNLFALTVQGDSMVGAGILSGDKVVVRQQASAQNGDIVVAMLENEATVKHFRQDGQKVWLMPDNPNYSPIDGTDAVILGKVVGVLREY